jgi:phenylacetate-CoA ligase
MGPVAGRSDDMVIIRGLDVYPSQVEAVLLNITELSLHERTLV